jgi:hypothetical protein
MSGVLYEAHRDYFRKSDSNVLVRQSETSRMNPLIDEALIKRELERDPDSAKREWLVTLPATATTPYLGVCRLPHQRQRYLFHGVRWQR